MNVRDSEAVGAMLEAAGHTRAEGESDADVIIVNSCTVRQKAEEKAIGKCGNLGALKDRPRIIGLMGCAVKRLGADVFKKLPKLDFAVGPRRFGMIPKIIADLQELGYPVMDKGAQRLEIPDEDEVPEGLDAHPDAPASGSSEAFRSYVTILLGCDNRCSYCKNHSPHRL
jgi:tRNA-2-methylthio-N6-dimethylallyladenosine synthase